MKANELNVRDLMLDDWVVFHDSGYASDGTIWKDDRVCQIDGIDTDVKVKWHDEDGCEEMPHVNTVDLSPIPITSEILEKNEFIGMPYAVLKIDDDSWLEYYYHEHRLIKWWSGIDEWENHSKVKDITFQCHCIYVHELQHALRMCGIKKEVNL